MLKNATSHAIAGNNPAYACTAERMAVLFGISEEKIRSYARAGMLPRLADGKHDCVWLLNLAIGQQIADGQQVSLTVPATVVLGWLDSIGDDLENEDVRAFIAVFKRNGFTHSDFQSALDAALHFCDSRMASR
ncbi:hypothetical protein [Paraburkholderia aspalathi]|uniref:hypothetical protein n=1 Tax=Paraburkholderia aspalathi TaxID=1324617 RepID=UPI001B14CBFD|nr:hypothetical protein [Paraburkholderia aspalathi]CAE6852550.1 hypothetical protein R20943_07640 [Paraburkholderia aspalathi]